MRSSDPDPAPGPVIRTATPGDYDALAAVVDGWWGREMLPGLQRLFLDHFCDTSLVAELDGRVVGFLVGFHSPARPEEAYIHFVGVDPTLRGRGLARMLYEQFFAASNAAGRTVVSAITSPVNAGSIAFHRRMGFQVAGPIEGYNGPARPMIVFTRALDGR